MDRPKTYFPKLEAWFLFTDAMREKGFRLMTADEAKKGIRGYGLTRPKSRSYQEPGEICFIYAIPQNDYRVIVWTTKREGGWVKRDSAFVIMVNSLGKRVHTSRPLVRKNSNFFGNLFTKARDMRWRLIQRPEHCGRHMEASHRRDKTKAGRVRWKSSLWRCAVHPDDKTHVRGWNDLKKPFPAAEEERIKKGWRRNAKKNKKLLAEDKEPYAALRSRIKHPWLNVTAEREADY